MNIAEKSMEKTRFYNREDLKAKDVARLISIWEGEAGESFTGEIIDYFGGLKDIKEKLLRTPLPPIITFDDDPLRILRGIRFSITKRLRVSEDMWQAMKAYDYFDKMPVVSEERIREELTKCFKYNSSLALGWLSELTDLRDYIFKNTNLWLKPTSEK